MSDWNNMSDTTDDKNDDAVTTPAAGGVEEDKPADMSAEGHDDMATPEAGMPAPVMPVEDGDVEEKPVDGMNHPTGGM